MVMLVVKSKKHGLWVADEKDGSRLWCEELGDASVYQNEPFLFLDEELVRVSVNRRGHRRVLG